MVFEVFEVEPADFFALILGLASAPVVAARLAVTFAVGFFALFAEPFAGAASGFTGAAFDFTPGFFAFVSDTFV
ncbi:MAG: hypothetical protein IPK13_24555 [Deltaproteobacteria bacterium]|nr:hypothetical protein [Deltaproteobacteria bacterium]